MGCEEHREGKTRLYIYASWTFQQGSLPLYKGSPTGPDYSLAQSRLRLASVSPG